MVISEQLNGGQRIVLTPNRSMSWRGNQIFLLGMICLSGMISVGFALIGAWVILPFAGLEMLALGSALYYVSWKLSYQQVIVITEDSVAVDKGVYKPKKSWLFSREALSLSVQPEEHEWSTPVIQLRHKQSLVEIGEFLNQSDCRTLLALLKEHGIPTRTWGAAGKQAF